MEKEKNSKKALAAMIGIATTIGIALFMKLVIFAPQSFDDILKQASNEINKNCPMVVDSETTLNNTTILPGRIFQYNYRMSNLSKDSIDVEYFKETMKPPIINSVKTNPDLKQFRDKGVTLTYSYVDMDGKFVAKITVTPEMYSEE